MILSKIQTNSAVRRAEVSSSVANGWRVRRRAHGHTISYCVQLLRLTRTAASDQISQ